MTPEAVDGYKIVSAGCTQQRRRCTTPALTFPSNLAERVADSAYEERPVGTHSRVAFCFLRWQREVSSSNYNCRGDYNNACHQ